MKVDLFGLPNQLLGLIAFLGLILISISSYVMQRKRKPSGKLGAPSKPKNPKVTIGVTEFVIWPEDDKNAV